MVHYRITVKNHAYANMVIELGHSGWSMSENRELSKNTYQQDKLYE